MGSLLHSESRRLYSWWWDSHISPKNSKWLQQNLTDMDAKVKTMIKLIEEDADSFAKRADMYYKKRPELMKLVEEFYRAYRALAERYDNATGELRQVHRTMTEAFPNQVPFLLSEDSSKSSSDSHEYSGESDNEMRKKGLKQLHEMLNLTPQSSKNVHELEEKEKALRDEVLKLSNENHELKEKVNSVNETESEVKKLNEALLVTESEKERLIIQYHEFLEKLSDLETKLNYANENSIKLNEKTIESEGEVCILKEKLNKFEIEKEEMMNKHEESLKKLTHFESMVDQAEENSKELNNRVHEAENESRNLKLEISKLEFEKNEGLNKISELENKLLIAMEKAKLCKEQADLAEDEVMKLKKAYDKVNKEKEALNLQYKLCLEKITQLEKEISIAQEDIKCLNNEVQKVVTKFKKSEEKNVSLEISNQSLLKEAENLAKKIAIKDEELLIKQIELEKVQNRVQEEQLRHSQTEKTLRNLENLHSKSSEEQSVLANEIKNGIQMLKDLETCRHSLEDELWRVRDENNLLIEEKLLSNNSINNLENEVLSLKELKEKLEKEVCSQIGRTNTLQNEVFTLREEIMGLNGNYKSLITQVESLGLKPEDFGAKIKHLMDENSNLKQIREKNSDEKEALSKKLENMGEILRKNGLLEGSISVINIELEHSREKVKALQESSELLNGEKTSLVLEKTSVLSQLQILTESMQKLLERNGALENSLSNAKVEVEGLKEKSKGLEELCLMLKTEKSNLLSERSSLAIQLANVEKRLENLEKRFSFLEVKYSNIEDEKEFTRSQVEELRLCLALEKQERNNFSVLSESKFTSFENHIQILQEENKYRKQEFESELEKSVKSQFEIYVLQKFIKDMEEKNYGLLLECQKHVEASNLADKLISELERENLEQQVESELLLDEIEKLRLDIYRIFKALETNPPEKIENIHNILRNIEGMKCSIGEHEETNHRLLVENSILVTLLKELKLDSGEIEFLLKEELKNREEKLVLMENDKYTLLEMNRRLKNEVAKGDEQAKLLEFELKNLLVQEGDLQEAYVKLQNETKLLSNIKKEKVMLEQENDTLLLESLNSVNLSTVYENSLNEKIMEIKLLSKDFHELEGVNFDYKTETAFLTEMLEVKEAENQVLKDSVQRLEMDLEGVCEFNDHLNNEISNKEGEVEEIEKLNSRLSEESINQNREIESLNEKNEELVSEVMKLSKEIQEQVVKEEDLSLKLDEKNNETELWEAEASTFYFDLQISSIRQVLYEDKVHELSEVCESLEDKSCSKTIEIEEMKEKISSMESEIGGLKFQLDAYTPVIASLRADVASLEQNALVQIEDKGTEATLYPLIEGNGIEDLKKLQTRIKAVESSVQEMKRSVIQDSPKSEIEEIKPHRSPDNKMKRSGGSHKEIKSLKPKLRVSDIRDGIQIQMKDIPLDHVSDKSLYKIRSRRNNLEARGSNDQMLELWETSENCTLDRVMNDFQKPIYKQLDEKKVYNQIENFKRKSRRNSNSSSDLESEKELGVDKLAISISSTSPTRTSQDVTNRKILERLVSDSEKLTNLQMNVQNLRRKVEAYKKYRKSKDFDFETVKEQLQEVEETIVQLSDLNSQLIKTIEDGSPRSDGKISPIRQKKISEQTRKGSEKIGRLQIEVQKIQSVLVKMEEETKSKGKSRFLVTKTSIILRDFINNGKRGSGRRKKSQLCGCFKPSSSSRDGNRVSYS